MTQSWRIGTNEYCYIKRVLEGGFPGSSSVNFTAQLEKAFAQRFNCDYAISFTNGTATLHAALAAVGVGQGDQVIVPPLTMASTTMAVLYQHAQPVFADIDPHTLLIDPADIERKITPNTKAIIPVSLYGLSPDMDPIMALADKHGLTVIEDAAQCFLGTYRDKIVGSMGHVGSFSFQNSKHMTCGEGGMVTTDDGGLAHKMRQFSSLGYGLVNAAPGQSKIDKRSIVRPDFKRHVAIGYNYRLSELCAAVLMAQLERLEELVDWRRRTAGAFMEVVDDCGWLHAQVVPEGCEHAYWAYTVVLDESCPEGIWGAFYDKFIELGGDGFYGAWALTYQEPMFENEGLGDYGDGICPNAEKLQPRIIQLKTHYGDDDTIARQAEALAKTIRFFDA